MTRPVPSQPILRPLREEDAEAVVGLYRKAFGDQRPIDAAEIVSWYRNPEVDPELLRVLEVDGRIVGYGDLEIGRDAVAVEFAAPGHWDAILEWAEDVAEANGVPRVRVFFPAGHEVERFVAARGYSYWRSAYTMEIDLGEALHEPVALPAGVQVRTYEDHDEETLRLALNEVFAGDPFYTELTPERFREFYLHARGSDPALWLLAWDGEELAGFALGFSQHAGDMQLGWIESLGVRASWRKRGLGASLLRGVLRELQLRGFTRAGLGVDAGNETGALNLYERAGMRVVRRGDNWIRDVARRSVGARRRLSFHPDELAYHATDRPPHADRCRRLWMAVGA